MIQVFTKKHKKSSCLAFLFFFLGMGAPTAAEKHQGAALSPAMGPPYFEIQADELGLSPLLFGKYQLSQPARMDQKNQRHLNSLVDELSFYIRPIARPRLQKALKTFQNLEITSKPHALGIKTDKFNNFVWTPLNGEFQEFKNTPKGDFALRRWVKNGILHSEATQDGPIKQNRYYLSNDGQTLRLEVTVTSKYLPHPLELAYLYKKVG